MNLETFIYREERKERQGSHQMERISASTEKANTSVEAHACLAPFAILAVEKEFPK